MTNRIELISGADPENTFVYVNNKLISVAELIVMGNVATRVDASGCTNLTTLDLPAATWVDARGCTGLTTLDLPAATTVDASGCTGLTSYIYGGTDIRGYCFVSLILRNERRVLAGYRNFSIPEARQHWENNVECLAFVEKIAAEAARSGENVATP